MPNLPPEGADPDLHVLALAATPEGVERLRGALERAGCDAYVACARHGDDAREYVRDSGAQGRLPDLVVVDLAHVTPALAEFLTWMDQRGSVIRIPTIGLKDCARMPNDCERRLDALLCRRMGPREEATLRQILADLWFHGDITRTGAIALH